MLSKKEIESVDKRYKKKLVQITFGIDNIKKTYKFHKKNYKIIFIGNIKYAPNKKACFEFASKVLPIILKEQSNIEFHIIGEISKIDRFLLSRKKNVKVLNKVKNLESSLNRAICGIANLEISTGIQTKLLSYMSFGLPSVCSKQVAENFDGIKKSKINYYRNNEELAKIILKYKRNKIFSLSSSKRSLNTIKKFKWEKVLPVLNKLIA